MFFTNTYAAALRLTLIRLEYTIITMEKPLITVSGSPGSGTTTLVGKLTESLNFESVNGGDVFRSMAVDRGISLAEFSTLAERNDEIDKELDSRLESIIDGHLSKERKPDGEGLIVESRLAGWHANGRADLSVWLDAPVDVRVSRIEDRDETAEELQKRELSEAQRYKDYYQIDIQDLSVYDIVLDTDTLSIEGMVECVLAAYNDTVLRG